VNEAIFDCTGGISNNSPLLPYKTRKGKG